MNLVSPFSHLNNSSDINVDYICSCMEHCIHLGAGAFIKAITPTAAGNVMKKVKNTLKCVQLGDESLDLEEVTAALEAAEATGEDGSDIGDGEDDEDFNADDASGKSLTFVKQVCALWISNFFSSMNLTLSIRFTNLLKPKPSLAYAVRIHSFQGSSSYFGYVHIGHLSTPSLIMYLFFAMQVLIVI